MSDHALNVLIGSLPREVSLPVPKTGNYRMLTMLNTPSAYQGLREIIALACMILAGFYFRAATGLLSGIPRSVLFTSVIFLGYITYFALGIPRLRVNRERGIVTLEDVVKAEIGVIVGGRLNYGFSRYQGWRNLIFCLFALVLPTLAVVGLIMKPVMDLSGQESAHLAAWIMGFMPSCVLYLILGFFKRGGILRSLWFCMLAALCVCLVLTAIQILVGNVPPLF